MRVETRKESSEQGQGVEMANNVEGVQTGRCSDHVVP